MAAAINLQRDAGVILSNLQILSQFAMAMNRMSFSMMALGLGRSLFPKAEINDRRRRFLTVNTIPSYRIDKVKYIQNVGILIFHVLLL